MHKIVTTTTANGAAKCLFIHTDSYNILPQCDCCLLTTVEWQTLDNNVTNHIKWFWVLNICISKLEAQNGINEAHIHLFIYFKEHLLMRKPHRCKFIHIYIFRIEFHSIETN